MCGGDRETVFYCEVDQEGNLLNQELQGVK